MDELTFSCAISRSGSAPHLPAAGALHEEADDRSYVGTPAPNYPLLRTALFDHEQLNLLAQARPLAPSAIAQAHGGDDADVDLHVRAFKAWRFDLAMHVAGAAEHAQH